jgi:hypothetical protein
MKRLWHAEQGRKRHLRPRGGPSDKAKGYAG